ncbi:hypothetical protein M8312_13145 [Sphingomonas sp. KRR8]|uniref:hypothetical protein n=1 Tax=Sphingomonas sp. KRR8 TaxID=2942996 RepID=UPI002021BC54|nr:hypothetical protein [Sphingomonas sp. KRR8]URD60705.1 hypothetical protein M8312_13145 [Sphingomonas sp. KRR8]
MSEEQPEDEYRFGFTKEQFLAELRAHEGLIRDGGYVPTRREVATWPPARLNWHLLGRWWESPSSLIPNDAQVAECVAVLQVRPDGASEKIQQIIARAPPFFGGREGGRQPRGGRLQ